MFWAIFTFSVLSLKNFSLSFPYSYVATHNNALARKKNPFFQELKQEKRLFSSLHFPLSLQFFPPCLFLPAFSISSSTSHVLFSFALFGSQILILFHCDFSVERSILFHSMNYWLKLLLSILCFLSSAGEFGRPFRVKRLWRESYHTHTHTHAKKFSLFFLHSLVLSWLQPPTINAHLQESASCFLYVVMLSKCMVIETFYSWFYYPFFFSFTRGQGSIPFTEWKHVNSIPVQK